MPVTFDSIATVTLGSNTAAITFSGIPSTFTDLRLVVFHQLATSDGFLDLTYNGDTGTNYSSSQFRDGSALSASKQANVAYIRNFNSFMNWPALSTIDIFGYADTGKLKASLDTTTADDNDPATYTTTVRGAGLWRSTSAITSITLTGINSVILAGSRASLYGIKRA